MTGLIDIGDRRAHLLASLEYGTSPLLPWDLYENDDDTTMDKEG